jgi:hypothetical protein
MLVPHRLAMALQAWGWCLRSDAPWFKRNGLSSSTKDRINCVHETVFMLTKSNAPTFWTHPHKRGTRQKPAPDYIYIHRNEDWYRDRGQSTLTAQKPVSEKILKKFWRRVNLWESHDYYYDRHAVLKPLAESTLPREHRGQSEDYKWKDGAEGQTKHSFHKGIYISPPSRNWRTIDPFKDSLLQTIEDLRTEADMLESLVEGQGMVVDLKGNVLAFVHNVVGYPGAHYAVYPRKLVEGPIKATSSKKACPTCGAPWFHHVEEKDGGLVENYTGQATKDYDTHLAQNPSETKRRILRSLSRRAVRDYWLPTCECAGNYGQYPSVVLDPCMGSGTTGVEAVAQERRFVGNDINQDYVNDAERRIMREGLGMTVLRTGDTTLVQGSWL